MKYDIRYKPTFATVFITLNPGERLVAEAGAMASMDGGVTIATSFSGGLIPALLKTFLGGESLFINTFSNPTQKPCQVVLTQSTIGDVTCIELKNRELCLQPGAYIAHAGNVHLGVHWAGFSSWLAGEGLFKLKVGGNGIVFLGAYGGLSKRQVNGEYIVDSGHLVAYDPSIKMNIKLAGGLIGSVTSGEGLVNRLTGKGEVYLQSRSISGLVGFLRSKIRW
ncbi:TIGR00266 family protein [Alkalinema pantanalense CENA528]|uniref:TIGR00266 family protein n=1 Tax=Alkalinema pantanalense TaxID=1620705 RepID=UPI003D6F8380